MPYRHLSLMQSQFWLVLIQQACRMGRIDFDQVARATLFQVEPCAGEAACSLTTAQLDRLLMAGDRVLRARGSGLFALELATGRRHLSVGVISGKPTLHATCEFIQRYHGNFHPGYRFILQQGADDTCLIGCRIRSALPEARQCHEQGIFAMLLLLLQQFPASDGARLHSLRLSSALLRRYPVLHTLELPLVIDEDCSGLCFDSRILAREAPGYSRALDVSLQGLLDAMLRQDSTAGRLADLVLDLLLAHLSAGRAVTLNGISAELRSKPRTLQHQLGLEGTSFNQLRGQAQVHLTNCLIAEGRSTDEIVARLGFSSRSAFHHAFTRLTGLRPLQVRRSLRAQPDFCVALASEPAPSTL